MNRKQRRAAHKHGRPAGSIGTDPAGDQSSELIVEALEHERHRRFDEAIRAYKRALQFKRDHAEACNNLGRVLLTQGKNRDASIYFARSLALMPQLLKQYAGIRATLIALLPTLADVMQKQATAWPRQLNKDELFGEGGLAAIADDALLLHVLQSIPVQDVGLERLLTTLRRSLLADALARNKFPDAVRNFACALARQCFINEYIFATSPDEDAEVARLNRTVHDALMSDFSFDPTQLAVLAMYEPLHVLAFAPMLLDRTWTPDVDALLTQQLREPMREIELRDSIPRLTAVEDDVSLRVQQQYEENPYPRWIHAAGQVTPLPIDQYLRDQFPGQPFVPLGKIDALDVLIAGCGTGEIAIASVQKYLGAQALAVDLSLSSLSFAKRSTPAALAPRIEYAQADILQLARIGRSFDVIDCSGVLHHMADPDEGWRALLTLLRPGGFMHLGFYSEAGRRDVVAARAFITERHYRPTPNDIRRCRQQLLETPLSGLTRFSDFFTTSECRDLLFHVQEARMTIPRIKAFIDEHRLTFLGFEFEMPVLQQYRNHFAASGWSMTDLARWHEFETRYPDTFSGMYQFWIQKP